MFWVSDQSPKLPASNSEYTDIVLSLPYLFGVQNPPVGSQVDFQVQALIGHIDYAGDGFYSFTGQKSDWSNTQTITIGESQTPTSPPATPTPTPSQESQQTEQEIIIGAAIAAAVIVVGVGLLIYLIKRK